MAQALRDLEVEQSGFPAIPFLVRELCFPKTENQYPNGETGEKIFYMRNSEIEFSKETRGAMYNREEELKGMKVNLSRASNYLVTTQASFFFLSLYFARAGRASQCLRPDNVFKCNQKIQVPCKSIINKSLNTVNVRSPSALFYAFLLLLRMRWSLPPPPCPCATPYLQYFEEDGRPIPPTCNQGDSCRYEPEKYLGPACLTIQIS